jgi:integration host factor subunit alpha
MTLTKTQITESIRQRLDFSKNESSDVIESLLEIIKDTLENGEDVMISGFGKFCVTEKKERKGRNPATGDDMILPKRRIVTFKCSGKLKEMINK